MGHALSAPLRVHPARKRKPHTTFPRRIVIVRHGQSRGNVDETEYSRVPDWQVELTETGRRQAQESGKLLRELVGAKGKLFVYCSPYKRCQQTLEEALSVVGSDTPCHVREEPRLREQDFGNFQDPAAMKECKTARNRFGRFFYRFPNGESGADVFDRVSTWLESLYKEMEYGSHIDEQTTVLLCTHGLTGRLVLMRWLHWTVQEFEQTWNPPNAQLLVMERAPCSEPHAWSRKRYQLTPASLTAIGIGGEQPASSDFVRPTPATAEKLAPTSPPAGQLQPATAHPSGKAAQADLVEVLDIDGDTEVHHAARTS